jgi:hypothetical protein
VLLSVQHESREQQTNLKNIAKGKIDVHWYENLDRARILGQIIFNSADEL